ncbi:hypothetical protein EDD16DRAFT_491330 [Pisolithus croceorrhizus]|nr:hypothetical protein EDD16DRAFT_491330 [Pisolithus croceorrhizus]
MTHCYEEYFLPRRMLPPYVTVQGVPARKYFPTVGARIPVQQVRFRDMPPNTLLIHLHSAPNPSTIELDFVVAEDTVNFSQVQGERFSREDRTTNTTGNQPTALMGLLIRRERGIVHQSFLVLSRVSFEHILQINENYLVVEIIIVRIRGSCHGLNECKTIDEILRRREARSCPPSMVHTDIYASPGLRPVRGRQCGSNHLRLADECAMTAARVEPRHSTIHCNRIPHWMAPNSFGNPTYW